MTELMCLDIIVLLCCVFAIISLTLFFFNRKLMHEARSLHEMTQRDELTKAYSRRYFFEILEYHLKLIHRYNNGSAVIMIDIDNFKEINDTYGHLLGDEVLMHIVKECNLQLRESDILARFGGDEFILLCPFIAYDDLVEVTQRIQNRLMHYKEISITLSLGVCFFTNLFTASHIIHHADKALYNAKKNGKNRVEFLHLENQAKSEYNCPQ